MKRKKLNIDLIEQIEELISRKKNKDWYASEDFERIYINYGINELKNEILLAPQGKELWLQVQKYFIN